MTSIETRTSWVVAFTALVVMSIAYGAPFVSVVALKQIAAELGSARSVPALAYSLAWLGSAFGGVAMGRIAERIGVKWTVAFGALMIGVGLVVSTGDSAWRLWVGHGVFMGLLGNAGINAPCYVYVSRWFDRHRGSALALITSGQYVAGAIWPPVFERGIAMFGWRQTMLVFAFVVALCVVPLALLVLRAPPEASRPALARDERRGSVLGLPANLVMALLAAAAFMCCVPMAMPQGHLVAFCTDLGIAPSHGAAMLSVLLGCAFVSRQFWGWVSDRIGGLRTVLAGSICQIVAMIGFLLTRSEAGCSRSQRSSAWASAAWCPLTCSRYANCFPQPRRRGACRRCCCSAARGWPRAVGSPACCTTGSVSTAQRSWSAWHSTWPICAWSAALCCGGNGRGARRWPVTPALREAPGPSASQES